MRNKLIAYLAKYLMKATLATCRISLSGREHIQQAKEEGPLILMLWHNRLAPLAEILLPLSKRYAFSAFISKSRDGDILSHFVLSYKNGQVIRVPHNAKDAALKALIDTLKQPDGPIALITPDGPRGPAYQLKPGVLFAAKEAKATLIPFTWTSSSYFELKTWDRFRFPLPFTTLHAHFGPPLKVTEQTTLEDLKKALEDPL
jgi:hypothetical protein